MRYRHAEQGVFRSRAGAAGFGTDGLRRPRLLCRTCGIESFAYGAMPDGTPMVAINVKCLDGVEPLDLPVIRHDGRDA